MLIYAKRSFRTSPRQLAGAIRALVEASPLPDLQRSRQLLVATGQLEQAILDADRDDGSGAASAATLAAADLFLAARRVAPVPSDIRRSVAERLARALAAVEENCTCREVGVRVPEGFAWYALYPDSYAQTAAAWARHFGSGPPDICVIGLRSIGTTLAAVVAQTLQGCGLAVTSCFSVRTSGPPFSRTVELPAGFAPASHNIVVDEGPGLSGSSMVAVARALERAGADPERIHFFAGHRNGPGPAADADVRHRWRSSRVWTTDLDSTVIGGSLLPDALSSVVEAFTGERATGPAESLGLAAWTTLSGLDSFPRAIAPNLETPKKIVRLHSGRAVLLKFAGFSLTSADLGTDEQWQHRAMGAAAIAPHGASHGWVAMPWIEGVRLAARDGSIGFLTGHLGPWIAASVTDVMSAEEVREALGRITAALAAWAASRGRDMRIGAPERIVEAEYSRAKRSPQHCYGDGRLAPHEWIRTSGGVIRKADRWPHHLDHSWVGRQPIAWDIAGAEIEWELDGNCAEALRKCVQNEIGYSCSAASLAFCRAGYCVFRAAAAFNSAMMSSDARVREHLVSACHWYEERMQAALADLI